MVDCAPAPAPHGRECKGCPGTLCKVCHGTGHALGCPVERSSNMPVWSGHSSPLTPHIRGDTSPYDLVVDHGHFLRVQVKCTIFQRGNSYQCHLDHLLHSQSLSLVGTLSDSSSPSLQGNIISLQVGAGHYLGASTVLSDTLSILPSPPSHTPHMS